MEEAQTDTTVVPQGVVAAMKALREKQRAAQGKYFLPSCLFYIYEWARGDESSLGMGYSGRSQYF